jgi:ribose 5-phosphate isomerase B
MSGAVAGKVDLERWDVNMRVAVGADNRGLAVRDDVVHRLQDLGHETAAMQMPEGQTAEYPEIASWVAYEVQQGRAERGILIARTGMGMCIVANKFSGIRAVVGYDEFVAEMSRRYLDANVLCLSADLLGEHTVGRIIETWLTAPFEGGRHARRIERISMLEPEGKPRKENRHGNEA